MKLYAAAVAVGLCLVQSASAQSSNVSYFFNNTNGLGPTVANLTSACSTALLGSIPCDGYLKYVMTNDYYGSIGNTSVQDTVCNATCGTGLASYRANVVSGCAGNPQPFSGYPATFWVDSASSVYSQLCLKDQSTGQYCTAYLNATLGNLTTDQDGTALPTSVLCSNCVVNLFKQLQSTSYSNYEPGLATVWSTIQSKCNLSYNTTVPALVTNVTTPGNYAPPTAVYNTVCLSNKTYTVASGDNCNTIAISHNVSTGALISINSLLSDCSNLLGGQSLCLPPACTAYTVQSGDTCSGIANKTSITFQQMVAWNPSLNTYCTNLIAGQSICVSPPGGVLNKLNTIASATVTQTAIYATSTVARPSPVASGTTLACGKYYLVQQGDYCQLVALNASISLSLFEAINPSINSNCSNLLLNEYYCVFPLASWNATVTSTIASPPAPTPSGTTSQVYSWVCAVFTVISALMLMQCYQFYTVQSGDNCGVLENNFAISFAQLQYWNPSINSGCTNLLLGDSYCVNGVSQPPSTTTTSAAKASSTAAHKRAELEIQGGVPYGWPGLRAPRITGGVGIGSNEL